MAITDEEAYNKIADMLHQYWDKGFDAGRSSVLSEVAKLIKERIQDCSMRGDIALSDLLREVEKLG